VRRGATHSCSGEFARPETVAQIRKNIGANFRKGKLFRTTWRQAAKTMKKWKMENETSEMSPKGTKIIAPGKGEARNPA